MGVDKLFRGIIHYNNVLKPEVARRLNNVQKNLKPYAVLVTCMDSRMIPSQYLQLDKGDMFMVRNAGNLIPHSSTSSTTEGAALDFACVHNGVENAIVCGHSDCRAMNAMLDAHEGMTVDYACPIHQWLHENDDRTRSRYQRHIDNPGEALIFNEEQPRLRFEAYINEAGRLCKADVLSQINTLQQVENMVSYPHLRESVLNGQVQTHGMWYDLQTASLYYFSRKDKRYIDIDEHNLPKILSQIERKSPNVDDSSKSANAK